MPPANHEPHNLDLARRYLAALERGDDARAVGEFLNDEIVAQEFPNRLVATGQTRDRAEMLAGVERGRELMQSQCYDVLSAMAVGESVALEVAWSGTLAVPFGPLAAGSTLRARVAIFLEFQDGRIIAQRNYDCYEPW